jgi:asparagine synthase (glutamine-hydrolysing)
MHTPGVMVSLDSARAVIGGLGPRGAPLYLRVLLGPDEKRLALSGGRTLVWRGRLDDRCALIAELPGSRDELALLNDAELFARYFDQRGIAGLAAVLGSWAAVVDDSPRGQAWLMRDPMGGRSLTYLAGESGAYWVGHDAGELLEAARRPVRLDPRYLSSLFACREAEATTTPFWGVVAVPPGHAVRLYAEGSDTLEFWRPALPTGMARRPAVELEEELRVRLRDAVACRVADGEATGLLLSGGLDSVPIAAMARQVLGPSRALAAFSWVFDRYPEADERSLITLASGQLDLQSNLLPGDDELPLGPTDSWPVHPGTPEQNPYRRLHERAYEAAAAKGTRVLLSGMCGDQLWSGSETWLRDAWSRGRYGAAAGELFWHLATGHSLRPALADITGGRRREPAERFSWLTAEAVSALPDFAAQRRRFADFPRPHQAELLLGAANGHGFAVEAYFARRYGLELRYPLRDRRLVELVLGLPTADISHRGVSRALLRRALAGLVPNAILARRSKARFTGLFVDGVYGASRHRVAALVRKPNAAWRRFVRSEEIEGALAKRDVGRGGVSLWLAASLELWLERSGVSIA